MDEKPNLLRPLERAAKLACQNGHKVAELIRGKLIEIKCHSCGHFVTIEYTQGKFLIRDGTSQN